MSSPELNRLLEDLRKDPHLLNESRAVLRDSDAALRWASDRGYRLTLKDVGELLDSDRELSGRRPRQGRRGRYRLASRLAPLTSADWLTVLEPRLVPPLFDSETVERLRRLARTLPGECQGTLELRLAPGSSPVDLSLRLRTARDASGLTMELPLLDP